MRRCQFSNKERVHYPVTLLCQVIDVAPSSYYAWRKRAVQVRESVSCLAWETSLERVFTQHQKRYATRRLQAHGPASAQAAGLRPTLALLISKVWEGWDGKAGKNFNIRDT